MLTFTLDTNCLIDVAEGRPNATAVRALADAHTRGEANVAVVAIMASENQKSGAGLTNFEQFRTRLDLLSLGHIQILKPMFYWDITFWDWAYWVEPEMVDLERNIHHVLFPNIEYLYADFSSACGLDSNAHPVDAKWRNAKCDVQAFWCHAYRNRSVFVTSDKNFHAASKKPHLVSLSSSRIELPSAAAMLL